VRARQILFALLVVYGAWLIFAYRYHFLDGVNLLFHEAGHVFFGVFGQVMHFLGGTLGQLVFPVATAVHFARRDKPFEAAVCVLWLGESLMYAAMYVGDARARALPLVNDGFHDWNWLLGHWHVLDHAETLGTALHLFASAVVIAALLLAARSLAQERSSEEASEPRPGVL
jgi:hypothetical protein